MKLDPDCVRDVLIAVEDNTSFGVTFSYPKQLDQAPTLSKYSDDVIKYHIMQCAHADFISIADASLTGYFEIIDLTPKGHEFLANIRSDNVWNHVKQLSVKVGSGSISALSQIAVSVITALINAQLNL